MALWCFFLVRVRVCMGYTANAPDRFKISTIANTIYQEGIYYVCSLLALFLYICWFLCGMDDDNNVWCCSLFSWRWNDGGWWNVAVGDGDVVCVVLTRYSRICPSNSLFKLHKLVNLPKKIVIEMWKSR